MKNFAIIVLMLSLLPACNPNKSWKRRLIENKDAKLTAVSRTGKMDTTEIKDLVHDYEAYAEAYPDDTAGARFLFKAAEFYRYMRKPDKAIETYRRVYNNYPSFETRPYALFLQGFIFENELGKIDSARAIYKSFLTNYPNDPLSKDVRITLDNLGKSPEQLIKEFEQKQQADSVASTQ
jgi:tetratricopeptide (TPR) repeat protein